MCDMCFSTEIKSFPTEEGWLKFDLELTIKLGKNHMKYSEFTPDGIRDKDDGSYIYECNYCGQKWRLKEPDYSIRGYFFKT